MLHNKDEPLPSSKLHAGLEDSVLCLVFKYFLRPTSFKYDLRFFASIFRLSCGPGTGAGCYYIYGV